MTSTTATTLPGLDTRRAAISRAGWGWLIVIGILFVALFSHYVSRMIHIATKMQGGKSLGEMINHVIRESWSPDWSHVLVIPLISLYFVFRRRGELIAAPQRINLWGLPIFFLGVLSYIWWIHPGRNDMLQGFSMVTALFGLVLFLLGGSKMKVLWFPIVYMLLFVKVSYRIWNEIANQLQNIAAATSTAVLKIFALVGKFDVNTTGNTIEIGFMKGGSYVTSPLTIAEACSGLRMLMAFVALGVAMAFLSDRNWWQRLIMLLMAVPIAVAVNVGRVVSLGLLTMVNDEMTRGDFHTMVGMFMLIPAAGLFWLLGWVLDKLVIDEKPASFVAAVQPAHDGHASEGGHPTAANVPAEVRSRLNVAPVVKGAAVGIVMTGLIGLAYYGLFLVFQPTHAGLTPLTAKLVLVGALLLLALAGVYVRYMLHRSKGHTQAGHSDIVSSPMRGLAPANTTIALGIVVGVLATALSGFSAVKRINNFVLIKDPVELRKPLYLLVKNKGPWERISESPPMDAATLEVLGTNKYISWNYRDNSWDENKPGSFIRLHVAYYTGIVDTVSHVPERCMVATGGADGIGNKFPTITVNIPGARETDHGFVTDSLREPQVTIPKLTFPITIFRYRLPGESQAHSVAYFFVANGKFMWLPDQVRLEGFDPRDRFSYYCKIEIGVPGVEDVNAAARRAEDFLAVMLPEIMSCLPDWQALNATENDE